VNLLDNMSKAVPEVRKLNRGYWVFGALWGCTFGYFLPLSFSLVLDALLGDAQPQLLLDLRDALGFGRAEERGANANFTALLAALLGGVFGGFVGWMADRRPNHARFSKVTVGMIVGSILLFPTTCLVLMYSAVFTPDWVYIVGMLIALLVGGLVGWAIAHQPPEVDGMGVNTDPAELSPIPKSFSIDAHD